MAKEITVPTSGAIVSYQVITEDYNHWTVDNVSGVTVKYHDETTTESISGSGQDNFKIVFPKLESTVEKPYLQETVEFPMNVEITSGICEGVSEEVTFKQQPYYTLTFNPNPINEDYYLKVNEVAKTSYVKGTCSINLPCHASGDSISFVTDDERVIDTVVINSDSELSEYVSEDTSQETPTSQVFLLSGDARVICNKDYLICSLNDNILYPIGINTHQPNTTSISIQTKTTAITQNLFTQTYADIKYDDVKSAIDTAIRNGILVSDNEDEYYINYEHPFNGVPYLITGTTNNGKSYMLGIMTNN